jgi:hypothetical protein
MKPRNEEAFCILAFTGAFKRALISTRHRQSLSVPDLHPFLEQLPCLEGRVPGTADFSWKNIEGVK